MTISTYNEFIEALSLIDYNIMGALVSTTGAGVFAMIAVVGTFIVASDIRTMMWSDTVEEEAIECEEADLFLILAQISSGETKVVEEITAYTGMAEGLVIGDNVIFEVAPSYTVTVNNDLYDMDKHSVANDADWQNKILMEVPVPVADNVTYTYRTQALLAIRSWANNQLQTPAVDRKAEVHAHQEEVVSMLEEWPEGDNFTVTQLDDMRLVERWMN